jgi:hypothetical protein
MKATVAVILWFLTITTVAVLVCSCGVGKKASCDAYGQVDTEERI